ncbi:MAG TPA: SRPBCC domain-containing protein [Bacteroidia bacterium]|nr:SRPBCC domain-containing protein [Bacteroidia bacterium]
MTTKIETKYVVDASQKKMIVEREFAAPVSRVWAAWTQKDLLDKWWAPKPWKAETKSMNFKDGGHWHYSMVGPDGTRMWARIDYSNIEIEKRFDARDTFCDENGNENNDLPKMSWKNLFQSSATGTKVVIEILYKSEADMKTIIEMGFKEGFAMAHDNLDELLAM